MEEYEWQTTSSAKYDGDEEPPCPEPPSGKGWRLVGGACYNCSGVRHYWYWERVKDLR